MWAMLGPARTYTPPADITAPPLVTPSLGPHWSRPGSRDPRQPITAPDEIGVKSWLAVDGDLFAASL